MKTPSASSVLDGRDEGAGSGCEDELVVRHLVALAGVEICDGDGLGLAVDGGDLRAHAHLDAEATQEQLGLGDQELVAVLDLATKVVGQAAVGEGHVRVALEDDDLGVLVHAAGAGGGRGATGHAADDKDGGGGFGQGSISE